MNCPNCNKSNPEDATKCECGYVFKGYQEPVSTKRTEAISRDRTQFLKTYLNKYFNLIGIKNEGLKRVIIIILSLNLLLLILFICGIVLAFIFNGFDYTHEITLLMVGIVQCILSFISWSILIILITRVIIPTIVWVIDGFKKS